ncbi:MAG: arylsulfatase [Parasphingopyxis sp.]|uniref:arylsulfatase n=1 Tax=Parasphingopyxis sp. TaxID=1920299 RepID=UPI0032EE322F
MKRHFVLSTILTVGALATPFHPLSAQSQEAEIANSPAPVQASRPNILVWMIDDLGFGQLGAYGGQIETPNIDRVAARGLRYNNYHTTPICSASRASFLTGRNSHQVHIGGHSAMAIDLPGHDALVPRNAGTIAENLQQAGYITYAIGKWDHLPPEDASPAGPFDFWPSGQGFDRFYGFLSFDADNFSPVLWSDHSPVQVPDDPDYHLTQDMADRAIDWIGSRQAVNGGSPPFMMYWATGAVHAPHHAPQRWLDHYRGRFDEGWDVLRAETLTRQREMGLLPESVQLPPRPEGMEAWDSLTLEQQQLYARQMEAFAAQLSHADEQFGRMLDALEARGELDNTIVVILSDNGASAEGAMNGTFSEFYFANGRVASVEQNMEYYDEWGTADSYPHYAFGWALAGNTPFRYYKQTAYEGGTRVPLIVSWPEGIADHGQIRDQYSHVSDLTPTLLEAAGVEPAAEVNGEAQMAFDGRSLTASFSRADASTPHEVQYYEMYGNRAIWADGWKAVVPHRLQAWDFSMQPPINDDNWELYRVETDVNELNNLADAEPGRLASMIDLFREEGTRFNVLPLINTGRAQQIMRENGEAALAQRDGRFRYVGPVPRVHEALAPPIHTHSFSLEAELAEGARNGTIMAMGGQFGGIGLYMVDGTPVLAFCGMDGQLNVLSADRQIEGAATIGLRFDRQGPESAYATILIDGVAVAEGQLNGTLSVYMFSNNETFGIGSDSGTTVLPSTDAPFALDGVIGNVTIEVDYDPDAEPATIAGQ